MPHRLDFGPTQAQGRREHRQEAVAVHRLGGDIGQGDQGKGQVVVGRQGAVGIPDAHGQRQAPNDTAHDVADQQAGRHRPQQALERPVIEPGGRITAALLDKQQPQDHEGKRYAIVEPGLPGQTEAHGVVVLGIVDLHQRGQYRVGRGQNRADQQGRPPRQVEGVMQQQADTNDAQDHHRSREPKSHAPFAVPEGQAQLESTDEQRKEHRDFRQVLHPIGGILDVQPQPAQTRRPDGHPECQAHGRGGHRHPAQE
ncbi:hypothetical protein D3C84_707140 [compost metagenome]